MRPLIIFLPSSPKGGGLGDFPQMYLQVVPKVRSAPSTRNGNLGTRVFKMVKNVEMIRKTEGQDKAPARGCHILWHPLVCKTLHGNAMLGANQCILNGNQSSLTMQHI